jgi:hypothetical protein
MLIVMSLIVIVALLVVTALLKNRSKQIPRLNMNHSELGELLYDRKEKMWETAGTTAIYHGGLTGDEKGPAQTAVDFILEKRAAIEKYTNASESMLREVLEGFEGDFDRSINDIFHVVAISIYEEYWEICFETTPPTKWIYVGIQFNGDEVISNTIDT